MDDRPNLKYPIFYNGEEIWPVKQWQWSRDRVELAIKNNDLVIEKKKGKWSVNYKQYLKSSDGIERGRKLFSIVEEIYTQQGTAILKSILPETKFTFPKPPKLIQTLIELVTDKTSIILDSFAGSGTTGHAVLNMNKEDGGNRKFILIEMEDYVHSTTSERLKRVISGFGTLIGTGGSFDFYELGQPLFKDDGNLNESVSVENIRKYIYYSETKSAFINAEHNDNKHFLGKHYDTAYYFNYEAIELTTLDHAFLATMKTKAGQYVIYADNTLLSKDFLTKHHIIFKKIPRDITRF